MAATLGKIADTIKRIEERFNQLADPAHAAVAKQFFREPTKFRGVRSPDLIHLSAELYRDVRDWNTTERNELCTLLWKRKPSEYGSLVCYLYRRFARSFGEPEFRLFEFWLNRYASNWGHCDGISIYLLAPSIGNVPGLQHAQSRPCCLLRTGMGS